MMRARWKAALLAVVASAGVAWGQAAPSSMPRRAEKVVTVQEKGGLPEKCRVLKTWTTPEGRKASLLQCLATDEMLTVVQTTSLRPSSRQVGAKIYRWGTSIMAPEGSPVPPTDDAVHQAAYTSEESETHQAPSSAVMSTPSYAVSDVVAAPETSCEQAGCGKSGGHGCSYTHHYEKPPSLWFVSGKCLPVCAPEHCPNYGYYSTQWRPWPGNGEPAPAPSVMTPE